MLSKASPDAPPPLATVGDVDAGLRLLRRLRREGDLDERLLAQSAINELLDWRLKLMGVEVGDGLGPG